MLLQEEGRSSGAETEFLQAMGSVPGALLVSSSTHREGILGQCVVRASADSSLAQGVLTLVSILAAVCAGATMDPRPFASPASWEMCFPL